MSKLITPQAMQQCLKFIYTGAIDRECLDLQVSTKRFAFTLQNAGCAFTISPLMYSLSPGLMPNRSIISMNLSNEHSVFHLIVTITIKAHPNIPCTSSIPLIFRFYVSQKLSLFHLSSPFFSSTVLLLLG